MNLVNAIQIKEIREELGLPQPMFGQLFGVHPITVSKWERGIAMPNSYQLALLDDFHLAAKKIKRKNLRAMVVGTGITSVLYELLRIAREDV